MIALSRTTTVMSMRVLTLIFCLAILILSGCDSKPKQLPQLRVGHAPHDHHSPLYIAAMNPEYFKENGGVYLKEISFRTNYQLIAQGQTLANVEIYRSTGGKEIIRKLSEDQFDFTFGGVPTMIHFIDQGAPIELLAPSNAEGAGLVVANDMPVANWQDFVTYVRTRNAPLRIGFKIDVSVQNLIFEEALMEEKITYSRDLENDEAMITLINLHGPKNLIPALEDGLIDGFVVNQPYPALAEHQEKGKQIASLYDLPPFGRWHGSPCCAVAGRKDYVTSHPEISEAFITLLLRANKFITTNPTQAAKQIATWLDLPEEVEISSLRSIKFSDEFDVSWDRGVYFWMSRLRQSGKLKGKLKETQEPDELNKILYNQELYQRARKNLE